MKMAGIRTHFIVAIASALLVVISKYGFNDMLGMAGTRLDPSRVASGVVTAVGFLGTGIILIRKQNVSGLTTSAGIWATVGVGMAVGAGLYFIGVAVSVIIVTVLTILRKKTRLIKDTLSEQLTLVLEEGEDLDALMERIFEGMDMDILSMRAKKQENGSTEIKLAVRYPNSDVRKDIAKTFREIPNIKSIEI